MAESDPSCPRCGAPRIDGPECPKCGVVYAKARPRPGPGGSVAEGPPVANPPDEPATSGWNAPARDAALERRIRLFAIPIALTLAAVVVSGDMPRALVRIGCSMWLHEAGHALVAWWCGFAAFPGPWLTLVADERSWLARLVVFAGLAALGVYAFRRGKRWLVGLAAVLLALQLAGSFALSARTARMLVTFGGDAGAMVLASVFMATMFARPDGPLGRGWLRWGFLAIGALAFADVFRTWWVARGDVAEIPYGENEGVGPSDPSVLADTYGWSPGELVRRHLAVAAVCLVALAIASIIAARRRVGDSPGPDPSG